ncbi:beta-glucosidase [Anaeromyces robustus]|uniref:beta-glucosidase n=1 Tax=Anaeromyces robustus TaxID=1754192 RepID=A0A1Y1WVD4_9FUNG|nr:beta-glucosidase [Anaeromyces robustus]|eukprot:ORX77166.1 beta-glucosidase [Anaeromyces robustus]
MKFSSALSTVALLFVTKSLAITWEEADAKAREWCADLTNEEKINIVHGRENMTGDCVGAIDPIERKGFAGLCLQDGPAGVRLVKGTSTSWQASINNAATFDKKLLYEVGNAQGKEFYEKGINHVLGPAVGILRAPASGRIWESYGEDPLMVGQCGAEVIKGIQDAGAIATVKHFVGNDQENNRMASSSNIPEQALWEVYLDPFWRAINDADVGAVMSSYNALNGVYAVQNKHLLTEILKEKMGFKGMVMSDWWSIYDVDKSFNSGLDMNMPGGKYWGPDYVDDSFWGPHIQECIDEGKCTQERLDDAVITIIRTLYKAGQMENYSKVDLFHDTLTEENKALNRKVGADSNVLLKNDDAILPIKKEGIKKIAIIGKDAMPPELCDDMKCANGTLTLGWGSGTTDFKYVIDPLAAITERAEKDGIEIVSSGDDDAKAGAEAAKDADLAIVFVQADSGEEYIVVEGNKGDRQNLDLWHNGNELVEAVAAANKNTIVVIHAPGPVNLPFKDNVKGIIMAGMPGQETGNAIADVLFGDVNPSGHLPYTWAPREDYPVDVQYDETLPSGGDEMIQYSYEEGLFIGYRWFDKQNIEPTFPFGFGLSYTTFEFHELKAVMEEDGLHVTVSVTNTGDVAGAAVPMIFLSFPESVKDYPIRLFKGFDKIMLEPGETKEVEILVDNHALSYYDVESEQFVKPEEGQFTVYAGANAKDLPLTVIVDAAVGSVAEEQTDDATNGLEDDNDSGDDSNDDDDDNNDDDDKANQGGDDDQANLGDDDKANQGDDDQANLGGDDKANQGDDDKANQGDDDKANQGDDDKANQGDDDDQANLGGDDKANQGGDDDKANQGGDDDQANLGDDDKANQSDDEDKADQGEKKSMKKARKCIVKKKN